MPRRKSQGFGLLELIVTLVVVSLLVTLAVPSCSAFSERSKVARAIEDIESLSLAIEEFRLNNNDRVPLLLAELGTEIPVDPWGRPYEYQKIDAAGPGVDELRKDGQLYPLNSDFDLYSRGEDGDSKGAFSAAASRDDVVRANNGAFIGLGEDY